MERIFIGRVVSTHGIKGELRIISDFEYKDKIFIVGSKLIIDDKEYIIRSYRPHKIYDMVTLNDFKDINEVLFLKGKKVYVDKESLLLNSEEILDSELMTYNCLVNNKHAKITEVFIAGNKNKIMRVEVNKKEILIPLTSPMIKEINKDKKEVKVELIEGMI